MKKFFFLMAAVVAMCVSFSSCSDDVADPSILYGTWDITHVHTDEGWVDITSAYYSELHASITFKEDGKYYGTGFFGDGAGIYTYDGKTVKTYVSGKFYMNYEIITLTESNCEVVLSMANSTGTVRVKARKR